MKKISLVSLVVFLIDRITKILITNNFTLNVKNKIIKKVFYITNSHNDGAAFSLFSGNPMFLILVTTIVLILIYKHIQNSHGMKMFTIISYGLLLGGIVGNLVDRVLYGYVIDFIDLVIFKYDFAIFNVADMAICAGAIMLLFEGSEKNERNEISSN